MSWFVRIEQACAVAIERTFARAFPSDLEPAQIARKLVATMEADTRSGEDGLEAPARYNVFVHGDDFERLSPHQAYLEREWAALLDDMAQRVNVRLNDGPAAVVLVERVTVQPGAVEIEAQSPPTSESPERAYFLRMTRGVPAYGVYTIDKDTRIGRSPETEIFLVDPTVSREHAIVNVREGHLTIVDLGSTNGTFVNGARVNRQQLEPGDLVTLGNTEMRVERAES